MKGVVRLGDATDHGGKVIQASSSMIFDGKPAALVGDLVSCPKKGHGENPIIEGADGWVAEGGRKIVVHGCKCACGCIVLSSLNDCSAG